MNANSAGFIDQFTDMRQSFIHDLTMTRLKESCYIFLTVIITLFFDSKCLMFLFQL